MITIRRLKKDWFTENPVHTWTFRNDHLPTNKGVKFIDVIELSATGEDLEHIRKHFDNVPITIQGHCIWKGMMAQFIYDNLE